MHRHTQAVLVGFFTIMALLTVVLGLLGLIRAPGFRVDGLLLGPELVSQLASIDDFSVSDHTTRNFPLTHVLAERQSWWVEHEALTHYLNVQPEVMLHFLPDSPYRAMRLHATITKESLGSIFATTGLLYLSVMVLLGLAWYIARLHRDMQGFLLSFSSAALAVLGAAMIALVNSPLTLSSGVIYFLVTGLYLGLFGLVALTHFVARFPGTGQTPSAIEYVVYALYVLLIIKTVLYVFGGYSRALSLTALLAIVGLLLTAAAVRLLWLSRGMHLPREIRFALVPVLLMGVAAILLQIGTPDSVSTINAVIGLSPVIPLGLALALDLQRDYFSRQIYVHHLAQERQAIRRELHDGLLNDLAGISATVQGLRREVEQYTPRQVQRVETLDVLSRTVAKRVRQLLKSTLNETTTWDAFVTSMVHYSEQMLDAASISMRLELDADLAALPPMEFSRSVNLEHVFREAIVNILKHARATEVCVRLKQIHHMVWIEIQDNGHGYRMANRLSESCGLDNMRYRMNELGGDVEIRGVPNMGTHVRLRIPISDSAANSVFQQS